MQTVEVPTLDSALAKPCDDVPEVAGDGVDDLIDAHVELIKRYADCSARHKATVEAWKGLR